MTGAWAGFPDAVLSPNDDEYTPHCRATTSANALQQIFPLHTTTKRLAFLGSALLIDAIWI